jgi:hypothetical protein
MSMVSVMWTGTTSLISSPKQLGFGFLNSNSNLFFTNLNPKGSHSQQFHSVATSSSSTTAAKRSLAIAAAAAATAATDSNHLVNQPDQESGKKKYYFVVANAKFMLDEEEHFKELLFERLRLYGERNKEQDFWLVIEPKFLDKFPNITNRLKRPAVALVSTNGPWITFMKLRLDRVLSESYEAVCVEEALASNPTELKFEKPDKWVAPYPKYEFGWWEPFLPSSFLGSGSNPKV